MKQSNIVIINILISRDLYKRTETSSKYDVGNGSKQSAVPSTKKYSQPRTLFNYLRISIFLRADTTKQECGTRCAQLC